MNHGGDGVPFESALEVLPTPSSNSPMNQNMASAQAWRRRWIRAAAARPDVGGSGRPESAPGPGGCALLMPPA